MRQPSWLALPLALGLGLGACRGEPEQSPCDKLAAHIGGILAAEKGGVTDEAKAKAIKDLAAACKADSPSEEELECALKATTRAALEACDPKDEEDKEEK